MRTIRTKRYPRGGGNGPLIFLMLFLVIGCVAVLTAPDGFPILSLPAAANTPMPLPQPTATAANSTLTLERQSWYGVQLAAYDTLAQAEEAADNFKARGAGGFILEDGLYRVLASAYPVREEADSVLAQLQAQAGFETAVLYRLSADEVLLQVVATPIQASALSQGFALLPELIRELSRLSLALDREAMDAPAVRAAAGTNQARAQQLLATMELSLAGASNAIVTGLTELLEACASAMEELATAEDDKVLSFSAQIKYNHLDILWRYVQYVRAMTAYGA